MTDEKKEKMTEQAEGTLDNKSSLDAVNHDTKSISAGVLEGIEAGDVEETIEADIVAPISDEEVQPEEKEKKKAEVEGWQPKTEIGKKVRNGEIKSVGEILDSGQRILEPEIVEFLIPDIESDLMLIGQSKGKFGGGQRRVFKQTQKKTQEGNKPKFATFAVSGNRDGIVGIGYGKAKETVPAREKAFRNSKLNVIKIRRGCGDWRCG